MSGDVVDAIDRALTDYATSVDAMRWVPDVPEPERDDKERLRLLAGQYRRYAWNPAVQLVGPDRLDYSWGDAVAWPVGMLVDFGYHGADEWDALPSYGNITYALRPVTDPVGPIGLLLPEPEPADPRADPRARALHLRRTRNVGPGGRTPAGRKRRTAAGRFA